jgi:cell wall-associated NlpC family hydrolase
MTPSPVYRRALASLLAGVLAAGLGVAAFDGSASADPKPSLSQVRRQVAALNHQAEQATERYNTARVELGETTRRLEAVRHRFRSQRDSFTELQGLVGRIAAATYKNGTVDPAVELLLSDDPTTFLRRAGDLEQLGQRQDAILREMATARLRLEQDRAALRDERADAADLQADLAAEKRSVEDKLEHAHRLLASLEAEERARLDQVAQRAETRALDARDTADRASRSAREGTFPTEDGPASGRAADAVKTAYDQLGDPYAWGASGPGSFDCSGLTMFAWAAAGVSLPHSSSAQYDAVRHIDVADLQPGDLVFYYSPISHVGIYVGGGRIIDAPYPGRSVHVVGLYSMPLVGAGRP